ncbi:MAG: hypothetical protein JW737_02075 [Acidobacteria bacterium]|nr:hypothetical protein [Acidobacteriota bacterium]
MNEKKISKPVMLFILSILLIGSYLYSAPDYDRYTGMCFGVDVTYFTVSSNDFNGTSYFENDYELIGIPSIDSGPGLRLILGSDDYRMSMGVVLELSLVNGEFLGESVDVSFTDIYFFMRHHFLRNDSFSMYIEGNFGMSSMSMKDNVYFNTIPDDLYDSKFTGLLFGAGFGINQYLSDNLYLDLSAHADYKLYPNVEDPYEYSMSLGNTISGVVFSGRFGIRFVL